ncbi:LysM peptidoglycan-binding domain-containing protein [Peribacillus asahii]|uniref:LysM peptidoglycan-binding domain-containing protein n=1 Tax=Peribacillus asahii TaxID=228899 RepID=A0A398BQ91_9BACI|nr:LysM domain-containing protein [Peribacillus asahii]RID89436.1 LysM peptidoglycan-binding domain-containing protein [Peribacillus asahii]
MKRLIGFLCVCFILFIVYFDVTTGTLPKSSSSPAKEPSQPVHQTANKHKLQYVKKTMKPGDTLLSIIEQEEGSLKQPIESIVRDFQELNEGLKPEQMQIGKTYKIPSYK